MLDYPLPEVVRIKGRNFLSVTLGYVLPNVEGHTQGKDAGFSSGGMLILD
jgi:hypothetical protein